MALTSAFKEAVSTGNVRRVRIMMEDSLLNDPSFYEFNAMKNAAQDLSGLYDTYDGRSLSYDKNIWNYSYLNELMDQLVGNFSHERIEHLQNVVKYLRPVTSQSQERHCKNSQIKNSEIENDNENDQKSKQRTIHKEYEFNRRETYFAGRIRPIRGSIIGIFAGIVIATVASVSVISGAVIGGAAGGMATFEDYFDEKKRIIVGAIMGALAGGVTAIGESVSVISGAAIGAVVGTVTVVIIKRE